MYDMFASPFTWGQLETSEIMKHAITSPTNMSFNDIRQHNVALTCNRHKSLASRVTSAVRKTAKQAMKPLNTSV